jgi:hypothetical protein
MARGTRYCALTQRNHLNTKNGMRLTLQDLKSHLWNCAEILRGRAVDRTDWKASLLTEGLAEIEGLQLVINQEYTRRVAELRELACTSAHDAGNDFFRALQILAHLRQ